PTVIYTLSLHDALPIYVHVDRSHRPDLVRLRLGDSTARDRLLIYLSLPITRWAAVSKETATDSGDLAFPLAWVSDHDRRRPHQTDRKSTRLNSSHVAIS